MSNEPTAIPETGFLRIKQVLRLIPISRASWWNWVKSGKAPAGIKLGSRTTVWTAEAIRELIRRLSGESVTA